MKPRPEGPLVKTTLVIAGTCLAASLPLMAAAGDGSYWDFRLGLGSEPRVTRAEYDYDNATPTAVHDFDAPGSSLELNVTHRFASRSPHGAFVTFGGFLRGFEGDDNLAPTNLRLGVLGVQGGGGYSFQPTARYTLEIGPRFGVGVAGSRERVVGTEDLESEGGGYARLDLSLANHFSFQHFQLGLTLGVASWSSVVRYEPQVLGGSGGSTFYPGADATYSGHGGYLLFSAGFPGAR